MPTVQEFWNAPLCEASLRSNIGLGPQALRETPTETEWPLSSHHILTSEGPSSLLVTLTLKGSQLSPP